MRGSMWILWRACVSKENQMRGDGVLPLDELQVGAEVGSVINFVLEELGSLEHVWEKGV